MGHIGRATLHINGSLIKLNHSDRILDGMLASHYEADSLASYDNKETLYVSTRGVNNHWVAKQFFF